MRRTLTALFVIVALFGLGAQGAQAFPNGNAPPSAMTPISSGVKCTPLQGQLSNPAAAAWNSMSLAAGERLPVNGCDSAYRPYDRQVYWREYWCGQGSCGNAAIPGTSNHGLGLAADVPQFVRGYIDLHGKRFGWCKCWSDAPSEWWHIKWADVYHRPNPGTNLHSPTLRLHSGGPGQNIYVRKIQKLLRGHGDKSVAVDGEFGRSTAIAIRRFQKAERIKVNGVVSPVVWKRLRRPISRPVHTTPKHVPQTGGSPAPAAGHPKHHPKPKPPKNHHPRLKGPAWGIDISSNNGCSIDFAKVRADGASFAVTKATEGASYVNPCFDRAQLRAIGGAQLVPGVYHWLSFGGASGKAQAAFFAAAVGHAGYGKGFLMPFVDVEEQTSVSDATACRTLGEFVHTLKEVLGEKPIIYTFPSYIPEHLSGCRFLNHYLLWIAHLGVSHPLVPSPWHAWALWQYTWTAHVAGVAGDVDASKVFGGRAALAKLRVRDVPRRVRRAPRAKVALPLAGASRVELMNAAPPAADAEPLTEVAAPEGDLAPGPSDPLGAALLHLLAALLGG
jgi:GH25 family lysozyme M1 (1,4-beta-N-acetylmuramidase)